MSNDPENQELPYTDDGPTEDVEIEITEDDLGESLEDYEQQEEPEEEQPEEPEEVAEQEEPEEEEAPKRRRSPEKRISELARKAADAERRAQDLEARLVKEAQLREQSEQAMMTHYRSNLSATAVDLKQKLAEARSMMDNERIDDLQYQFNKTMNDLEAVTNWEREQQNKAARAAPAEQAAPADAQRQQISLEPRTAGWIQKNTWFQPKSEDFDPEMHEEATLYARRVERRFRSEGRDDEIGSVDYFTEIDRHMRREFPDAFSAQSAPNKKAPPMSRDSNVAPVQRTAPGQPAKSSKTVRLTADQRRMAHQMAQSGAFRKQGGGRMSDLEAEKYYAIHMMKQGKGA
jgi:hypothetical protein